MMVPSEAEPTSSPPQPKRLYQAWKGNNVRTSLLDSPLRLLLRALVRRALARRATVDSLSAKIRDS